MASASARLRALQQALEAHSGWWRPAPFRTRRPQWCELDPALAREVLALDEQCADRLAADERALREWLAPRLPVLDELARLCAFAPLAQRPLAPAGAGFAEGIPARKLAQVEAFARHLPAPRAPLLEWCAGKGHLGRRLALADALSVTSLELDAALCREADRLAQRAGVAQSACCADALSPASQALTRDREVVALHACGELHRSLARAAHGSGASAYRIAPCCYHLGLGPRYRPLSALGKLALTADEVRLAVTETVTAPAAERPKLARDQAWKLGYLALREALAGIAPGPFRPIPRAWRTLDFPAFCRAMAARDGVRLPAAVNWGEWQARGEARRGELRRLELVRHAFRRALESWLVCDLAAAFEEAGYRTRLGVFCARELTPRNLILLAG